MIYNVLVYFRLGCYLFDDMHNMYKTMNNFYCKSIIQQIWLLWLNDIFHKIGITKRWLIITIKIKHLQALIENYIKKN